MPKPLSSLTACTACISNFCACQTAEVRTCGHAPLSNADPLCSVPSQAWEQKSLSRNSCSCSRNFPTSRVCQMSGTLSTRYYLMIPFLGCREFISRGILSRRLVSLIRRIRRLHLRYGALYWALPVEEFSVWFRDSDRRGLLIQSYVTE